MGAFQKDRKLKPSLSYIRNSLIALKTEAEGSSEVCVPAVCQDRPWGDSSEQAEAVALREAPWAQKQACTRVQAKHSCHGVWRMRWGTVSLMQ